MEEYKDHKIIFWKLVNYNITTVARKRDWFKVAKDELHAQFKFIQEVKKNPELLNK
jgi:hypothetical protein